MDLLTTIAVVSGLAGSVLGGLGWWKASRAMAAVTDCTLVPHGAVEAGHIAATANAGVNAANPPAPHVARRLEEPQGAVDNAQRANLVLRSGSTLGQDLPTNQGTGSGLLGVFLVNEGPAVAREVQLFATFPNGAIRNSEGRRSLSAHREMTLFAQVIPQDFGSAVTMDVLYRVAYRDGNGEQALERKVRLDGGWKGPWKTFIEKDVDALVDHPTGAPVSSPGAEIDE